MSNVTSFRVIFIFYGRTNSRSDPNCQIWIFECTCKIQKSKKKVFSKPSGKMIFAGIFLSKSLVKRGQWWRSEVSNSKRRFGRYSFYLLFRNLLFISELSDYSSCFWEKILKWNFTNVLRPRDTPTSRKLRRTRWSGIVSGAKQRWWLRSRVFRYYNFYTTNSAWCDFSPLVFSNQEKMLEFIRNLRRSTSQQLRPSGNENIKINVTPPQGNLL